MGIITDIIAAVSAWLTGILGFMAAAVEGVVKIFYDGSADGQGLTVAGVLLLFGLAFTLVMFAFNFIRNLIRK